MKFGRGISCKNLLKYIGLCTKCWKFWQFCPNLWTCSQKLKSSIFGSTDFWKPYGRTGRPNFSSSLIFVEKICTRSLSIKRPEYEKFAQLSKFLKSLHFCLTKLINDNKKAKICHYLKIINYQVIPLSL